MNIASIIHDIGKNGPFILFLYSLYLLWSKEKLFFYYSIGFFINLLLNLFLKGVFKQPRPSEDIKLFELALSRGKRILYKDGMPYDMFGMPSGHAQSCFYSTVFIFLSLQKNNISFFYLIIAFLTIYQRVIYKHHTTLQVIVGAIIGILTGYLCYYFSQQNLKGNIREKLDDNAPS